MCVCVCVCVCVRVRACVRACVCVCERERGSTFFNRCVHLEIKAGDRPRGDKYLFHVLLEERVRR